MERTKLTTLLIVVASLRVPTCTAETVKIGPCIIAYGHGCKEVELYVATRDNTGALEAVTVANITKSSFKPDRPTKLVVHGYASDMDLSQLVELRKAYLTASDVNVLVVQYESLVRSPCYPLAVGNARYVAGCLAIFLRGMVQKGMLQVEIEGVRNGTQATILVHAIGLSLGGQTVGLLADRLRPEYILQRITGLDPALPLFVTSNLANKLDATDAVRVDVLHTNAYYQGKAERCGHLDFYFNNGITQPGCEEDSIVDDLKCDHLRSATYFTESIWSPSGFWGWTCPSIEDLLRNRCPPEGIAVLGGEHWDLRSEGSFAVVTQDSAPFAKGRWWQNETLSRMILQTQDRYPRVEMLRKKKIPQA